MDARHKLERRNFIQAQTAERNILKGKNLKAQTKRLTQLKRQMSLGKVNKSELNKFIKGVNASKKLNSFQKAQVLGSLTQGRKKNQYSGKIAENIAKTIEKMGQEMGKKDAGLIDLIVKDQIDFLIKAKTEMYEKVAASLRKREHDNAVVKQYFKLNKILGKIGIWRTE